jgi:hypothetical protein
LIYPTYTFLGSICAPSPSSAIAVMKDLSAGLGGYLENLGVLSKFMADVDETRFYIMASALVAMIIGMVWMVVMKLFAPCITWSAILLLVVSMAGLTYYLYD